MLGPAVASAIRPRVDSNNPVWFDDFVSGGITTGQIGQYAWLTTAGTTTHPNAVAGHPGLVTRDTTATSGTIVSLRLDVSNNGLMASEMFDVTWWLRLNNNDTDTKLRAGIGSSPANDPPNSGVYLEKAAADTSWFGVGRATSVESRTAAIAAVSTTWVKLRCRRIDTTTVAFSVDGGTEVTLASNVPGAILVTAFVQIVNAAAASKTVDLDAFQMEIFGLSR